MKKFLGILLLFIVVVVTVLYFARDFLLKEYLERKMSKANNAPVTIGSVDLNYFESYVTLKDIKVMSNLHKDEIFISIDELKSYYEIQREKSYRISAGDTIIIKKYGKFRIEEENGLTKKDKVKLIVRKYI